MCSSSCPVSIGLFPFILMLVDFLSHVYDSLEVDVFPDLLHPLGLILILVGDFPCCIISIESSIYGFFSNSTNFVFSVMLILTMYFDMLLYPSWVVNPPIPAP